MVEEKQLKEDEKKKLSARFAVSKNPAMARRLTENEENLLPEENYPEREITAFGFSLSKDNWQEEIALQNR